MNDVRSTWQHVALKYLIQFCRNGVWGDDPKGDEHDLSCARVADFDRAQLRIKLPLPTQRNVDSAQRSGRILRRGDLLLEKSGGGEQTSVGAVVQYLSDEQAVCSNFVALMRAKPTVDARWLCYWHAHFYASGVNRRSIKQTTGIQNLDSEQYLNESALVPPLAQQYQIATYLDRETARIDALIEKKTRFIELLREKRQALITQAVTQGLDPTVPMKDSGVEWLGRVPAHWRVVPLKSLVSFHSGSTPSKENKDFWDGNIPWASAKDLKVEVLSDTQDHLTTHAFEVGGASKIPVGSVLVVVRGMILAKTFPVCRTGVPMAINQDIKALVPRVELRSDFLAYLLRGTATLSLSRLEEAAHGTKALRMEQWVDIRLPLPPLDEQGEIAQNINRSAATTDTLIELTGRSIELLKERRSALITAAVTGQIDLRDAA